MKKTKQTHRIKVNHKRELIQSLKDITDSKKENKEIRKDNVYLSELLKLSVDLLEVTEIDQVFRKIVEAAVHVIGLDTGAIYQIHNHKLQLQFTYPPMPDDFPDEFRKALLSKHPHIGKVVDSCAPLVVRDIQEENLTAEEMVIVDAHDMRSLLYIPLQTQKSVVGVLILGTVGRSFGFTEREIDLSRTLSNIISMSLENSFLFEKLNEKVQELQDTVQRLRLVYRAIDQSPVSIIITDPKGIIEYVNPKFTEITGFTLEEAAGKTPGILKSGYQPKIFYKNLWETITSGKNWVGEIKNKNKNGEFYWESVVISPMLDEHRKITHFIAVKEDITEKKQLFENLVIAKEKAEESASLKTAFIHNISHEIRTPLNAIVGFSGFLAKPNLDEETRHKYVDTINQSNNQLLGIINDIINISHIETNQVSIKDSSTNIRKVFGNLHRQFQLDADKKGLDFRINIDVDESELTLITDEGKLIQIISNLLDNAFKFTCEGFVELGCRRGNGSLEFYVEDTGIGIPGQEHKKIFERFYQVDKAISRGYGGTGLGLAISFAYVELLGGKFSLKSTPGKGSVFSFTIPYRK